MKKIFSTILFLAISYSYGQTQKTSDIRKTENLKDKEILYPDSKSDDSKIMIDAPTMEEFDKVMDDPNQIYSTFGLEITPEYKGGIQKFHEDFKKEFNLKAKEDIKGKIFIEFIVEKDGSLSDIKIIRDLGFDTGKEAVRVIKLLSNWAPGKQNGRNVRVRYTLPIIIDLQANASK